MEAILAKVRSRQLEKDSVDYIGSVSQCTVGYSIHRKQIQTVLVQKLSGSAKAKENKFQKQSERVELSQIPDTEFQVQVNPTFMGLTY